MNTLTEKLADALREVKRMFEVFETLKKSCPTVYLMTVEALSEYDALPRAPSADPEGFTPGPWRLTAIGEPSTIVAGVNATVIADATGYLGPRIANARRIVACVNACEGIPTTDLELKNA